MKLQAKISLISIALLAALSVSIILVGIVIIDDVVQDTHSTILSNELNGLSSKAARVREVLEKAGVSKVESYVKQGEEELSDEFKSYSFGRTGELIVLDLPGRLIFGRQEDLQFLIKDRLIQTMIRRGSGVLNFTRNGEKRFCAFTTVEPWNWLMVLSITHDEMYRDERLYLKQVVLATLAVLALHFFVLRRYVKRLVARIQRTLDCVSKVEQGDFKVRIDPIRSKDEISDLQRGVNSMTAKIEQRTLERRQTKEALSESEERLRAIMDNSTALISLKDVNGRYLMTNRRFCEIFNISREEIKGKTDKDIFPSPVYQLIKGHDLQVLKKKRPLEIEERLPIGDTFFTYLTVKFPLLSHDGEPFAVCAISTDITKRKQAEQDLAALNRSLELKIKERTQDLSLKASQLELANRRLMALDEMKSSFLSSVSHELRTPLTSVLGFAKLISKEFSRSFMHLAAGDPFLADKGERILENARIIALEGERLTRLINDLLDLSKIESGRFEWRDADISVKDMVDKAVQSTSALFEAKPDVVLEKELEENLPVIFADPDKIQQLLINLLNNAAKFTASGRVTIRAGKGPADNVTIMVKDTGVGIPRQELKKVFDKFHQVEHRDSSFRRAQGTGLGLTICREIVEHYEGKITVQSELEKGSVFMCVIPIKKAPPAADTDKEQAEFINKQ